METYKIKKDNDDKNISFKLNGINKEMFQNTNKSLSATKQNSDYDYEMYQESIVGHKVSRLQNKNSRISNMIGNKAIAFSSIIE